MKRDMELIRLLLLKVEQDEDPPKLAEYSKEQQVYHGVATVAIVASGSQHMPSHDGGYEEGGLSAFFVPLRATETRPEVAFHLGRITNYELRITNPDSPFPLSP